MNPGYILVVDDEPDIRRLMQEILEDEHYKVTVVENAAAAREAVKKQRPDLVLLDIWMPGTARSRPRSRPHASAPTTSSKNPCPWASCWSPLSAPSKPISCAAKTCACVARPDPPPRPPARACSCISCAGTSSASPPPTPGC